MATKKTKNNKTIPIGYTSADTAKRLEWLKEKTGMDLKDDLQK